MEDIDLDKSALLEEVFDEVESLENSISEEPKTPKPLGFLEDVLNLEKETLLKKKKLNKTKKQTKESEGLNILEEVKTLIHEGLTDSSDDEDNKYFESTKYNDCGKNIKDLIKQKTISKDYDVKESPKVKDTWANAQEVKEKLKKELEKLNGRNPEKGLEKLNGRNPGKSDLLVDPVLGMRIINPLVSSAVLKEKMIGRVSVGTSRVKNFIESPALKNSDWVTGGVIVSKLTRTSQKGNQYCLWNVTDLNGDIKTICVFLFGSAYKEYWKTSLGTVVGILNPIVMDGREKSEATVRVDNAQKILLMGTSKDYGICKSKKKNGENCTSVVNTAKCDFCIFHMKKEYNKACRRSDLQPPKIGRSIDNLRAKVLGKNEVFYAGKSFTAVVGKKSSKQLEKDEARLRKLSQKTPAPLSQAQTNKNKDILSRLNGNAEPPRSPATTPKFPSALSTPKIPSTPSTPQQDIDLNFTVSKKDISRAKANALKFIQKHGPLKKPPDEKKTKRTPEQIAGLKRKLEAKENQENKKMKKTESEETNPAKEKLRKHGITDEFLKLMNSEAQKADLLKIAETEERDKYFNKLEMREKIEDKMASTFKVECKAVRCLKCNYKSFSASDLCKKEKHPLKVVNAVKRFWKCGDCSNRTVCLELVPLHSCKTCGSSKWERASMMREKKGPNLTVEPLSLRGHEEKFIGAVVKNANLSLLVPEESS